MKKKPNNTRITYVNPHFLDRFSSSSPHLNLIFDNTKFKFKFGLELENQSKTRVNQSSTIFGDILQGSEFFYFDPPNLQSWAWTMHGHPIKNMCVIGHSKKFVSLSRSESCNQRSEEIDKHIWALHTHIHNPTLSLAKSRWAGLGRYCGVHFSNKHFLGPCFWVLRFSSQNLSSPPCFQCSEPLICFPNLLKAHEIMPSDLPGRMERESWVPEVEPDIIFSGFRF